MQTEFPQTPEATPEEVNKLRVFIDRVTESVLTARQTADGNGFIGTLLG